MSLIKILAFIWFLLFAVLANSLAMFPASYEHSKEKAYVEKDKKYLFEVGKMHYHGVKHEGTGEIFVKPNSEQVFADFKESYDLGFVDSAGYLARMHFTGDGAKVDKQKGLKFFEEILSKGNKEEQRAAFDFLKKNEEEVKKLDPNFKIERNDSLFGGRPTMARLVEYDSKTNLRPADFQDSIDDKFITIEQLRRFDLTTAFWYLYVDDKHRRISPTNTTIDKIYGKTKRKELENLQASFTSLKSDEKAFQKITNFTNFKKSMKVYRNLQTKLQALGV